MDTIQSLRDKINDGMKKLKELMDKKPNDKSPYSPEQWAKWYQTKSNKPYRD